MEKVKDLVTVEENAVAVTEGFDDNAFAQAAPEQDITANDVMIPKILIMQPQSPRVVDQDNKLGDLVDTLDWATLATAKDKKNPEAKSFTVIPFHWTKFWIIKKKNGDKFEFVTMIKMDRSNQGLDPWEKWTENGVEHKREYMHLFHVIIPGKQIPYALAFKGASKQAGDGLNTQMFTINKNLKVDAAWKASPMAYTMEITPVIINKNDTTYATLTYKVGRQSTFEEACEALTWSKAIKAGTTETDHSDLQAESEYVDAKGGEF